MSSKSTMRLGLVAFLLVSVIPYILGAGHGSGEDHGSKDIERWGEGYMDKDDMKGMPMMCYKKSKRSENKDDQMSKMMMQQAAKLLEMVMNKTEEGDGIDTTTIKEVAENLKNMMGGDEKKSPEGEDHENTELGLELKDLVDELLEGGQQDGVTVTHGGNVPMNDDSSTGGILPAELDLTSLDIQMKDLLVLFKDPAMSFMLEGFGLGQFVQYLEDEDVISMLSQLDIETFNALLQSGALFSEDGTLNMEALRNSVDGKTKKPREENGDHGMTTTTDEMRREHNGTVMNSFNELMRASGVEGIVTENNIIESFLMALRYIITANETQLVDIDNVLTQVDSADLEAWRMALEGSEKSMDEMRKGEQTEMMEAFDKLMNIIGMNGKVNESNLMSAIVEGFQFILSAGDDKLQEMLMIISDLEMLDGMGYGEMENAGDNSEQPREEHGDNEMVMTLEEMRAEHNGTVMNAFDELMRVAGVEQVVTEDNIIQSFLAAMRYVIGANETQLMELVNVMVQVTPADLENWGLAMGEGAMSMNDMRKGEKREMMEAFDKLMSIIGIRGQVNESNIMSAILEAIEFVLSADDDQLRQMWETVSEIEMIDGMDHGDVEKPNNGTVMNIFDRILELAGVSGNDFNFIESVMMALRFIFNADSEQLLELQLILSEVSPDDLTMGTMQGGKSFDEMRMGDEREVMEAFDNLMTLVGVPGKVNEENFIVSFMQAMQFVLSADDENIRKVTGILDEVSMPNRGMTGMTNETEGTLMATFQQLMEMTGVTEEVTEENLLPSVMQALQYVTTADRRSLDMLLSVILKQNMTDESMGSMVMSGDSELLAIFNRLMALAGVGEVNEANLVQSVMQALQFLLQQDNETLESIGQLLESMGISQLLGGRGTTRSEMHNGTMTSGQTSVGGSETMMPSGQSSMDDDRNMTSEGEGSMGSIIAMLPDGQTGGSRRTISAISLGFIGDGRMPQSTQSSMGSTQTTAAPSTTVTMHQTQSTMGSDHDSMEGDSNEMMSPGGKRMGGKNNIVEMLERILMLTGVEGEVTEENVLEKTLMAMQFVMQADPSTIQMIVNELSNLGLVGGSSEGGDQDMEEGFETVCYPMGREEMMQLMGSSMEEDEMKESKETEHEKDKTMTCGSCRSDEELKAMMQEMVQVEVKKVFADVVTNMNGMPSVSREVKTLLEKMANGEMPDGNETMIESINLSGEGDMDGRREIVRDVVMEWGDWSEWQQCTMTCGGGMTFRTRTCMDESIALSLGSQCEETASAPCNVMPCLTAPPSVGRQWLDWEEWGPCSSTCGSGTEIRRRECVKRGPNESCEQMQSRRCFLKECEVATAMPMTDQSSIPFWSEWQPWSACTLTCGLGTMTRRRVCTDPTAATCLDVELKTCMIRTCPIVARIVTQPPTMRSQGTFSNWGEWKACSKSCGGGISRRSRMCMSEPCMGSRIEMRRCNDNPCTVPARPTSSVRGGPSFRTTGQPIVRPQSNTVQSPDSFIYNNQRIVFHGKSSGMKTFNEYRSFCLSQGGDLVRIQDVDKWVNIAYWIKPLLFPSDRNSPEMAWIGANKGGALERWSHPSDKGTIFIIWSRGEPQGTDQCAALNSETGHAFGEPCATARHYAICEYPIIN